MATATRTPSAVAPLDCKEATVTLLGPEFGQLALPMAPSDEVVDEIATSAVRDFLGSLDAQELEQLALAKLGGLEGVETVGEAVLSTLHELAGLQ